MLTLDFKYRIKIPNFDFSKELTDISRKIVIPNIQKNMVNEFDINGQKYAPLSPTTINIKKEKGYSLKILEATGKLKKSFIFNVRRNMATITVSPIRLKEAKALQVDGIKSARYGRRFFKFFGINDEIRRQTVDFMELHIRRILKNANS